MTGLKVKSVKTGEEKHLEMRRFFHAVGSDPATQLFTTQLKMDEDGYLITQSGRRLTEVPVMVAAVDVQYQKYRQAATSASSRCIAAIEAEKYLVELEDEIVVTDSL